MQIFNGAGDAVEVHVFCNTRHDEEKPTEMVEVPHIAAKRMPINTPSYIKEGTKLRCPECRHEVVVCGE